MQGRLTLLLGPPSCGKTTFLKALAGRLPRKAYTGKVTYNGHSFRDFCAPRTCAYVAQSDAHIAILTARETADFSYMLQHGSKSALWRCSAYDVWERFERSQAIVQDSASCVSFKGHAFATCLATS